MQVGLQLVAVPSSDLNMLTGHEASSPRLLPAPEEVLLAPKAEAYPTLAAVGAAWIRPLGNVSLLMEQGGHS